MAKGHSSNPQGPYYYEKGGQTFASLPLEMIQNIEQCPHFAPMKKDCKAEGIQLLTDILAQDPRTHVLIPQQYLKNIEAGIMPPMWNHNVLKEMAEKATMPEDQTRFVMMEFKNFEAARKARHTGTPKSQVSDIALQTDTCDNIYVMKDMLVAYMIAVVQNTQSLQYKQIQVALQMAQNHASIETMLRAEKLMTAHFNLAILTDNTASETPANAHECEVAIVDHGQFTSTSDQETTRKTPYRCKGDPNTTRQRTQPTGAVLPICRNNYGLVNGIPAGYESDNSWDGTSTIGEQDCSRNNDIASIVAFRTWTTRPNRRRGQTYGQRNNITVRGRDAPYSRPWEAQPYGRCTRSQQALQAMAYQKWQHRYKVP